MNNVKLLKCCFFQFFNSQVALKNKKKFGPQEKVEMTPLGAARCSVERYKFIRTFYIVLGIAGYYYYYHYYVLHHPCHVI